MLPRARIRPGFLTWSGLALLTGWALLTGAADGTTPSAPAVTGGLLAGAAALVVSVAKGLQLVVPVLRGGGETGAGGVRDLVVEMQAEARADRDVMRQTSEQLARAFDRMEATLRAVERAMHDNGAAVSSALQDVKQNSATLAAGIRQEIARSQGAR